jgi:single-strand DNA-binding protein
MTTVSDNTLQESQVLSASGRLGKDPEQRETKAGEPFTKFSIASTGTIIEDNEIRQETRWLDIQAFGSFADYCLKHLKKGDRIQVTGRFRKRPYQTKDGESRIAEEISLGGADGSLKILNSNGSSSSESSTEENQESEELPENGEAA